MSRIVATRLLWLLAAIACDRGVSTVTARGSLAAVPRVVISEVMANPRATPDERGEWFELLNLDSSAVDLRGWTVASENDRGVVIDRSVVIPPDGFAVLARDGERGANGGVTPGYAYGAGVALGNGADWLAVRTPDGQTTDSVSWTSAVAGASRAVVAIDARHADVAGIGWSTSTSRFGAGDLGTPARPNDGATRAGASPADRPPGAPGAGGAGSEPGSSGGDSRSSGGRVGSGAPRLESEDPVADSTLTIRVLDVGQGDAILVQNGGSTVLIDGGPEPVRYGRLLDRLGLQGTTVDVVILTHQHYDHYAGLRELFRSRRRMRVRWFFENRDPIANASLAELRDSIGARARRGDMQVRDTDDPCGNGASSCTITLRGGARLHMLRPDPRGDGPNNRSVAVKLLAPDSTAFSMWLAGDAEQEEIRWFDASEYDRTPGMRAAALKGNHHGSCDGISPRYLDLVRPELVIMSLEGVNDYGYVHAQTLDLLASRRIPWYRTDQNGTITITVPRRRQPDSARGYGVAVERGAASMRGPSDRRARSCGDEPRR